MESVSVKDSNEFVPQIRFPELAKVGIVIAFFYHFFKFSLFSFFLLKGFNIFLFAHTRSKYFYSIRIGAGLMGLIMGWFSDSYIGKFSPLLTSSYLNVTCPLALFCLSFYFEDEDVYIAGIEQSSLLLFPLILTQGTTEAFLFEQLQLPLYASHLNLFVFLMVYVEILAGSTVALIIFIMYISTEHYRVICVGIMVITSLILSILITSFRKKCIKIPLYFKIVEGVIEYYISQVYIQKFRKASKERAESPPFSTFPHCIIYSTFNFMHITRITLSLTSYMFVQMFITQLWCIQLEYININLTVAHVIIVSSVNLYLPLIVYPFLVKPLANFEDDVNENDLKLVTVSYLFQFAAVVCSFVIQCFIDNNKSVGPGLGYGQVRIFNSLPVSVNIICLDINENEDIMPFDFVVLEHVTITSSSLLVNCTAKSEIFTKTIEWTIYNGASVTIVIRDEEMVQMKGYDKMEHTDLDPEARDVQLDEGASICYLIPGTNQVLRMLFMFQSEWLTHVEELKYLDENRFFSLPFGEYQIAISNATIRTQHLRNLKLNVELNGIYGLLVYMNTTDEQLYIKKFNIFEPNFLRMWTMVPQFALLSLSEIFGRWSWKRFIYMQSPRFLKAVSFSFLHFCSALGFIVVLLVDFELISASAHVLVGFICVHTLFFVLFMLAIKNYRCHAMEMSDSMVLETDELKRKRQSLSQSVYMRKPTTLFQ